MLVVTIITIVITIFLELFLIELTLAIRYANLEYILACLSKRIASKTEFTSQCV